MLLSRNISGSHPFPRSPKPRKLTDSWSRPALSPKLARRRSTENFPGAVAPQESWAFGVGVLEDKFACLLFPEDSVCLLLVLWVSQARAECRPDPLSSLPYELGVPHTCGFLYGDEGSSHSIPCTLVHCTGWTVTPFPPEQLVTKVQTVPDESQSYNSRCRIFFWLANSHALGELWIIHLRLEYGFFCGRKHINIEK